MCATTNRPLSSSVIALSPLNPEALGWISPPCGIPSKSKTRKVKPASADRRGIGRPGDGVIAVRQNRHGRVHMEPLGGVDRELRPGLDAFGGEPLGADPLVSAGTGPGDKTTAVDHVRDGRSGLGVDVGAVDLDLGPRRLPADESPQFELRAGRRIEGLLLHTANVENPADSIVGHCRLVLPPGGVAALTWNSAPSLAPFIPRFCPLIPALLSSAHMATYCAPKTESTDGWNWAPLVVVLTRISPMAVLRFVSSLQMTGATGR